MPAMASLEVRNVVDTVSPAGGVVRGQAFGYLCVPGHVSDGRPLLWRGEMSSFALVQGLAITRWFTDDRESGGAGFAEMTAAIERGETADVVVPEAAHLTRSQDATAWLVRHVLRAHLGVRVCEASRVAGRTPGVHW